jgi:hypothetical protein
MREEGWWPLWLYGTCLSSMKKLVFRSRFMLLIFFALDPFFLCRRSLLFFAQERHRIFLFPLPITSCGFGFVDFGSRPVFSVCSCPQRRPNFPPARKSSAEHDSFSPFPLARPSCQEMFMLLRFSCLVSCPIRHAAVSRSALKCRP